MRLFKRKIRTRFAPSPTGYLHVGGLRTALYNYLYAKQQGGQVILRIEDTDRERLVSDAADKLQAVLAQLGIDFAESPKNGGPYGPYIQSERLHLYTDAADKLIANGSAYYCFCDQRRLEKLRQEQAAANQPPKYDRHCLNLDSAEVADRLAKKETHVIRLRIPEGTTTFIDRIRGEITVQNDTLDDQVLMKSDGYPTYHLANVVDDHLMKITHVIRGEEWIPSTPKHIILYRAWGWSEPQFAHLPLLLNADRSKLSKRQGDVAVEDYLAQGYLPAALLNFIALLGWHPGSDEEIMPIAELMKKFSLEKIQKGGAIFDTTKLKHVNAQYIKRTPPAELARAIEPFLTSLTAYRPGAYDLKKIAALFADRLQTLAEIGELAAFLYQLPTFEGTLLVYKKSTPAETLRALQLAETTLVELPADVPWTEESLRDHFERIREQNGLERGNFFWPLRVACSGQANSPDVFAIMSVLGKSDTTLRIRSAIEKLQ